MTKTEAIKLFDGVPLDGRVHRGQSALASALGISSQAVSQWPEELDLKREAWVLGVAMKRGITIEEV